MAIRNILQEGDPTLRKVSRPVTSFDDHLWQLLDDMKETLIEADGVGLAGPQVGILRRLFVMDVGEGEMLEVINPVIMGKQGTQEGGLEGCLSCPNKWGPVVRPKKVIMKAQDRYGKEFTYKGEDLMARCICHEYDHLDGILFVDKAEKILGPEDIQGA